MHARVASLANLPGAAAPRNASDRRGGFIDSPKIDERRMGDDRVGPFSQSCETNNARVFTFSFWSIFSSIGVLIFVALILIILVRD